MSAQTEEDNPRFKKDLATFQNGLKRKSPKQQ
jgi:hypothetical protein